MVIVTKIKQLFNQTQGTTENKKYYENAGDRAFWCNTKVVFMTTAMVGTSSEDVKK